MTPVAKRELIAKLEPYGQAHLLHFWDRLSVDEQARLAQEISQIDLQQIADLAEQARGAKAPAGASHAELARRAVPPPAIRLADQKGEPAQVARKRGEQALREGTIGVVLVAGGQGTRLGFDHPKGLFPIGPLSKATLFQILIEKVIAARRRYEVPIPLYVMTSPATHDETVKALADHDYFGLPAGDVRIFCQGTMPAVDAASGQLLLAEPGRLFLSPDGHGGMLRALAKNNVLPDMERRGLKHLFYFQIDNPLVDVCDPLFIGYHLVDDAEVSTQVVAKQHPLDRVGNVAAIDGVVQIIEYSDLPDDVAEQRTPDGSLKLWAGNIAVHMFAVAFLKRRSSGSGLLPFHFAHKKVPYVDDAGEIVEPQKPNAIKFEQFIFDLLPAARRALVVEVDERKVFAPVKNAPGADRDSPDTVRAQMVELYRGWLTAAGATVAPETIVEISPLFALDAPELAEKIQPGLQVRADKYFR